MLHARVATIGADWAFVGDGLSEINACALETINAGKNLRPDDAAQRFVSRISTAIVNVARTDGGDHAVLIERHTRVAEGALVAMSAGSHVLGAGFNPLDCASSGLLRRQRADRHLRV